MIRINVLHSWESQRDTRMLEKAVRDFEEGRKVKSFGDRHPELGKMFKCQVCQRRHRGTMACIPTYAKDENGVEQLADQTTSKGRDGAHQHKGRMTRHRNARGLQNLERARALFNDGNFEPYVFDDMDKRGKLALVEGLRELRAERQARCKTILKITKASRKINRAR